MPRAAAAHLEQSALPNRLKLLPYLGLAMAVSGDGVLSH